MTRRGTEGVKVQLLILVMALLAMSAGCEPGCSEYCEDIETDLLNLGLSDLPDCQDAPWSEAESCGECLDILLDLGVFPDDPDGVCEEYF